MYTSCYSNLFTAIRSRNFSEISNLAINDLYTYIFIIFMLTQFKSQDLSENLWKPKHLK